MSMKDELFDELIASVREGGAILRSEAAPSRKFATVEILVNPVVAQSRTKTTKASKTKRAARANERLKV